MRCRTLNSVLIKAFVLFERAMRKRSLAGDCRIFDTGSFPWARSLEDNWRLIRSELEQVLTRVEDLPNFQDISVDQRALTQDNRWKTFFLYGYGHKSEKNRTSCPDTTRLVENIPGMETAFFSILGPYKHLPVHRGPYGGVLRYHLGLVVPQEESQLCGIRVGSQLAFWKEGKSLIFDDSYPHEAWNSTDRNRVVLFVDFRRPLPPIMRLMNKLMIWLVARSRFVREGLENETRWEQKFYR
jgi:aspartyl/asparaginyl beta-hydroxylase (cupin superfamily)